MKHCIVFGGSRGIGAAISRQLLSQNYNVSIVSRNTDNLSSFMEKTLENNYLARPMSIKGDITDEDSINKAITASEKWFGPISILVNAAGINKDSLLLRSTKSNIETIMQTNLIGPMLTSRAVLKSMMLQKEGCIVNIGSIVGLHGNPGQCSYSASKAGLVGLTKSLAKEVASRNIRVNLIAPGLIETTMTQDLTPSQRSALGSVPLQRYGRPEDVANIVQMVVENNYITGQVLYIDGGLHLNT